MATHYGCMSIFSLTSEVPYDFVHFVGSFTMLSIQEKSEAHNLSGVDQ